MAQLKEVIEPGAIILLFTIGALYNRRSKRVQRHVNDCEASPSPSTLQIPVSSKEDPQPPSLFRDRFISRLLAAFPFLVEIWYWFLTYWIYQLARAASASLIRGNETIILKAQTHALQVLWLEKKLGVDVEVGFQQAILENMPILMGIFQKIYHLHIIVGVAFIVYAYTLFPLSAFQRVRRTIAMNNLLAFQILTIWQCMPPRLLPDEYGCIDILHKVPQSVWTNNKWQLTIAAMPSLHFGTSAFIGYCLWSFAPRSHRIIRHIALMYPFAMLATILATANHFLLDAIVGVLVPIISWRVQDVFLVLLPLEKRLFHLLRIEKPA